MFDCILSPSCLKAYSWLSWLISGLQPRKVETRDLEALLLGERTTLLYGQYSYPSSTNYTGRWLKKKFYLPFGTLAKYVVKKWKQEWNWNGFVIYLV